MARGRPRKAPGQLGVGRGGRRRQQRRAPRACDAWKGWCLCSTCYLAYKDSPAEVIKPIFFKQARRNCRRAGSFHERPWCDPYVERLSTLPEPVLPLHAGPQRMDVESDCDGGGCCTAVQVTVCLKLPVV
jgi:hypothetical protein